jgi:glutamate synthase (NADPH/NADH) small chain
MGNIGSAMSIINNKSNLPAICGRVCPHEKQCQGHCVMNKKGNPIQIGKLEQFIADFDTKMNLTRDKLPQKNRGKIAVIGSGPAGLTVAGDMARQGFSVTIFEGQEEPGGVLMFGIPEYRLPKKVVRAEIAKIEALGVNIICNTLVGENGITVDSLFQQGFDAIFMGTGTAIPQNMNNTPGATLRGVTQSTDFLHNVNAYNEGVIGREMVPLRTGEKVGVIGGGNVAMDAARTAIRLGADVTVLYRRTQEEMPAIQSEYEEAVNEGVKFKWETSVSEFIAGPNGRLGKCKLVTPEGECEENFDRIYLAIGSRPANRIVSTTEGIEVDEKGYVKVVDYPFGMTTRRGLFAGGDVVHRPQTVVLAMKAAKEVAASMMQYVDAIKLLQAAKIVEADAAEESED